MMIKLIFIIPILGLGLGGCSSSAPPAETPASRSPLTTPTDQEEADDLRRELTRPRQELAEQCQLWEEKVRQQQLLCRQGQTPLLLGPAGGIPLALPVWQQAHFSSYWGFSVPPYLGKEPDSGLALHLARLGDSQAAERLLEPGDRQSQEEVARLRGAKNYPLEWTRLAALRLTAAECRLARGDKEAVAELARWHQQIRQALEAPAQQGPLGAALLARGRTALQQAAARWRAQGQSQEAAAAEAALASWGEVPPPQPVLRPGLSRAAVERLLRHTGQGRALCAPQTLRALDLLALGLPAESLEAVVLCFDAQEQVEEILLCYAPGAERFYPQPQHLAWLLENQESGQESSLPWPQRSYSWSELECLVDLTPGHSRTAGLVRLHSRKARTDARQSLWLSRDLGIAHLDLSFSAQRWRRAPQQPGPAVHLRGDLATLGLRSPWPVDELAEVTLQRAAPADVLAQVRLRYRPEEKRRPLAELALPLWQWGGAARLQIHPGEAGSLELLWEDRRTRYVLHLPAAPQEVPEGIVEDVHSDKELVQRQAEVLAQEQRARQERLRQQRPWNYLPRTWEQLTLGQSRAQVQERLSGRLARSQWRECAHGLMLALPPTPAAQEPNACELVLLFDAQDRLTAVRAFYPRQKGRPFSPERFFLSSWEKRYGLPEKEMDRLPFSEANIPVEEKGSWWDDSSWLSYWQHPLGMTVLLTDRPSEGQPPALPAICYLPRGPEGLELGMTRQEVLKAGKVLSADGPLILAPSADRPYDLLVCWLEADGAGVARLRRLLARHREAPPPDASPAQLGERVADAWRQVAPLLGWPRRQTTRDGALQSWSTADDSCLVRIFWQRTPEEGPRLYTEWRLRPAPGTASLSGQLPVTKGTPGFGTMPE
jgi:hypothetical protein